MLQCGLLIVVDHTNIVCPYSQSSNQPFFCFQPLKIVGGAGVPTIPIRVPQIIEYDTQQRRQRISFSKLVDIIVMVSSSQDSFNTSSEHSTGNSKIKNAKTKRKYIVTLTFSDPTTQDIVVIESEEELMELMDAHKQQAQLTMVAHVEQDGTEALPPLDDSAAAAPVEYTNNIMEDKDQRHHPNPELGSDDNNGRPPKAPKLSFEPPKFTCTSSTHTHDPSSNVMVNLMEQLLEVQSTRMQQFADHMESRFCHLIEDRIVSSESNMKRCLRETVQLMDLKDESVGDMVGKKSATSSNLEKNVKDHLVSMELRFAKLEEQYAQTAALTKLPSSKQQPFSTTDTDAMKTVHERLDGMESRLNQRMEYMEQLMLTVRQDAEATRNATVAARRGVRQVSPSSRVEGNHNNSKPPLPPQHRPAPEPPLLLPRLDAVFPPLAPEVLTTPLPPSIPSSPRPQSPITVPHLPPSRLEERPSRSGTPPALDPMSPPTSEHSRYSNASTEQTRSTDQYDDEDKDDDNDNESAEEPQSPTREGMSNLSLPFLSSMTPHYTAQTASRIQEAEETPTTPPSSNPPSLPPSSESRMKQAIKDHMESMETRVSKLRELNNSSTTPSTAPNTATPATNGSSTIRALFPSDVPMEHWETQFATKLDELSQSLQSTIRTTTHDSVDHKIEELEKLLESRLEQIQQAIEQQPEKQPQHQNADAPPTNPRRRTSAPDTVLPLQELMVRRLDDLESIVQSSAQKMEAQEDKLATRIATDIRESIEGLLSNNQQPGGGLDSSILPQLKALLERRMDSVEALVQDTATEIENNTKTVQVRLQQALMDQILDALDPVIDKILNESRGSRGENSMATEAYSSVYGDEVSEVMIDHTAEMRQAHKTGSRPAHHGPPPVYTDDIVARDRQTSVFNIYGDMDIDDDDEDEDDDDDEIQSGRTGYHHKARGKLGSVIGRGKSLRDLCDINTIEEEDDDEWSSYDKSSHTKKSIDDSVVTARSESARNIYGDAIDTVDKHPEAPPTPVQKSNGTEEFDTPVTTNRAVFGDAEIEETDETKEKLNSSFTYGEGDSDQNENTPEQSMNASAIYTGVGIDVNDDNCRKDSVTYEEVEIDEEPGDKQQSSSLNSSERSTDQSLISQSTTESVPDGKDEGAEIVGGSFDYDDIGIDTGNDSFQAVLAADDIYDELSLDGVDDTKHVSLDEESDDSFDSLDSSESGSGSESANLGTGGRYSTEEENDYESSGYESESSREDEEYFHDYARQHLAVLASAMTRIRHAEKGTSRYSRFKEHIFTSRWQGPLSLRIRSEFDDEESQSSSSYDDESLRNSRGQEDEENYTDEDTTGTGDLSRENSIMDYERSKQSARVIAKAIAKYRVTKRAAKDYRRVLWGKFTTKRRGPLAGADSYDEGSQSSNRESESYDGSSQSSYNSQQNIYNDKEDYKVQIPASQGSESKPADSEDGYQERNRDFEDVDEDFSSSSSMYGDGSAEHRQAAGTSDEPDVQQQQPQAAEETEISPEAEEDEIPPMEAASSYVEYEERARRMYDDDSEDFSDEDIDYSLGNHDARRGQSSPVEPEPVSAGDESDVEEPTYSEVRRVQVPPADPTYGSDSERGEIDYVAEVQRIAIHSAYVEVREGVFRRVDLSPEEVFEGDASVQTEVSKRSHGGSSYVEIPSRKNDLSLFRRVDIAAKKPDLDESERSASESVDEQLASGESTSRSAAIINSLDEGASCEGNQASRPVQAVFDEDGDVIRQEELEQREASSTLARTQAFVEPDNTASPEEVWRDISEHSQREDGDIAEPLHENVVPQSRFATSQTPVSETPSDEAKGLQAAATSEKEMQEWERIERTGESKTADHDAVERVLLLDHIEDIKSQIRQWEEKFLASNESLAQSVHESIDDSHHFAAYLDKMLTERIGQLEEVIRTQSLQSSVALTTTASIIEPLPASGSPPRTTRSEPTTPMRSSMDESKDQFLDEMKVTVAEWKRLQDKLRGTEEVAEGYRKQVLQLRNVLEVKINEGNASLHQVEVLQRKLQEAHDRELQAQKQLRPVTKRVEQVIREMVELEESSANLKMENSRLRELLWAAQRSI